MPIESIPPSKSLFDLDLKEGLFNEQLSDFGFTRQEIDVLIPDAAFLPLDLMIANEKRPVISEMMSMMNPTIVDMICSNIDGCAG